MSLKLPAHESVSGLDRDCCPCLSGSSSVEPVTHSLICRLLKAQAWF